MINWTDLLRGRPAGPTVLGGGNLRLTPKEKLTRDIKRFDRAAREATSNAKRRRHLANLARSQALLEALEMEAR